MEYIDACKITEKEKIEEQGISLGEVSELSQTLGYYQPFIKWSSMHITINLSFLMSNLSLCIKMNLNVK